MSTIQSECDLALRLGLTWPELNEQARTAGSRYHVYPLLMGRKKRWIEAPDAELKMIQRRLLDRLLYELEPTTWAHGFTKGKSIVSNAAQHCGRQWVVSLDIKDFFPSVRGRQVAKVLRELIPDEKECQLVTDLVTRRDRLPQGAPTSPHLANLAVRSMDYRLSEMARTFDWNYTRYADDMSFSGDVEPGSILLKAKEIVEAEEFKLSDRKTTIRGRHQRQSVTGLVVNEKVALPREKRRRLRAMLHRLERQGEVDSPTVESLATINGHLAFLAMVSPHEFAEQRVQLATLLQAADA